MAYPIASLASGKVLYSDGTIRSSGGSTGGISSGAKQNYTPMNANTSNANGTQSYNAPRGSVLGAMDTGGMGGGGNPTGNPVLNQEPQAPGGVGISAEELRARAQEQARRAWELQVGIANQSFERARGIYDEGMGNLSNKRKEFDEDYQRGSQDILDRTEAERGNLQRGSQDAYTRNANLMRALGLGGSAMVRSEGKQRQNNARAEGDLYLEREQNERANTKIKGDNDSWANTQESSLNRYLQDAQNAKSNAENYAYMDRLGREDQITSDLMNIINQIVAGEQALKSAQTDIQGYQASPFGVDIGNYQNILSGQLPAFLGLGGNATRTPDANIQANLTLADQLTKKPGGSMYL